MIAGEKRLRSSRSMSLDRLILENRQRFSFEEFIVGGQGRVRFPKLFTKRNEVLDPTMFLFDPIEITQQNQRGHARMD